MKDSRRQKENRRDFGRFVPFATFRADQNRRDQICGCQATGRGAYRHGRNRRACRLRRAGRRKTRRLRRRDSPSGGLRRRPWFAQHALEELLARVRALVRRPPQQSPTTLEADTLSLNTVTFEVKRGNKVLSLTQKEFALLEYLLRNQGRPLSKELIISHVWDYDADILPNTVEVFVKYLRKKIELPGTKKLIHTSILSITRQLISQHNNLCFYRE